MPSANLVCEEKLLEKALVTHALPKKSDHFETIFWLRIATYVSLKSRQNEFGWKIFFFSKLWANLAASLFVHSPQLWALLCGLLCDLIVGAKVVTKLHTHLMSLLPYKKGFTITVFMLFAFTHQKEQPGEKVDIWCVVLTFLNGNSSNSKSKRRTSSVCIILSARGSKSWNDSKILPLWLITYLENKKKIGIISRIE